MVIKTECELDANKAMIELEKRGIGTRPFFWCLHEQPVIIKYGYSSEEKFPVAENLARRGFYLPSGLALKDEQMEYVTKSMEEIFC